MTHDARHPTPAILGGTESVRLSIAGQIVAQIPVADLWRAFTSLPDRSRPAWRSGSAHVHLVGIEVRVVFVVRHLPLTV
jgi:hypothetical protein